MSSQDALDPDPSGLLSDATLTALQLDQQPFGQSGPNSESFLDETGAEQLADIKQALITGDDLLLVLGSKGAGKTTLLKQLGENSGLRIQCFAVKGSSRFSTLNLFAGMLEAFKQPAPEKLKDILDKLIPCLQTMVSRNTLSAIVLDDAHLVSESELTQLLSSMLYINSLDETLMRVALAAPAELEDRIPDLLPEGADLPYSSLSIEGMSEDRAANFLGFRLEAVEFDGEWPFSDEQLNTMVARSGGLPGPLLAAAANLLNQRHGPLTQRLPQELLANNHSSLLQSRFAKLGLGVLGMVLIVGGLSISLPEKSEQESNRYSNNAAPAITDSESTLRLVESETFSVPTNSTPQAATTSSTQNQSSNPARTIANDPDNIETTPATPNASSPSGSDVLTAVSTSTTSPIPTTNQQQSPAASNAPAVESPAPAGTRIQVVGSSAPVSDVEQGLRAAPSSASPETPMTAGSETTTPPASNAAQPNASPTRQPDSSSENDDEVAPELTAILDSPTWILVQNPDKFTVQMSASQDRASVENFLKRNAAVLPAPNSIYTFNRDGDTWYALVHGLFTSIEEARTAVEKMPDTALSNQPWIRSIGRVQDVLRAQ